MVPLRSLSAGLGVVIGLGMACAARADEPTPPTPAPITSCEILHMSRCELEALFRGGTAARLPCGEFRGTPIVQPGSSVAPRASRASRIFWQGKIINQECGRGVNKFFGVRVVRAHVTEGESWIDSNPSVILDYSKTSMLFRNSRDEIRQVGPNTYLGVLLERSRCGPRVERYFVLEAVTCPE